MPHSDFAKLYDPANGLTCHFAPVDGTTGDLVESVRDMFIASMNDFGYEGYSRDIDSMFHLRSTYVYVTEATKIVMTGRVTPRPPGTIMPFEMGLRDDGGSYRLDDEEPVVDINLSEEEFSHLGPETRDAVEAILRIRAASSTPR